MSASHPERVLGLASWLQALLRARCAPSAFSFDGEFVYGLELILTALEHKTRLDRA
jgi:hypothetical protein